MNISELHHPKCGSNMINNFDCVKFLDYRPHLVAKRGRKLGRPTTTTTILIEIQVLGTLTFLSITKKSKATGPQPVEKRIQNKWK